MEDGHDRCDSRDSPHRLATQPPRGQRQTLGRHRAAACQRRALAAGAPKGSRQPALTAALNGPRDPGGVQPACGPERRALTHSFHCAI